MRIKTGRLIFPFDKAAVGMFPYLNIYSSVASACAGVRFFQVLCGKVIMRLYAFPLHTNTRKATG